MYDGRTRHARQVLDSLAAQFDIPVLAPIPKSIRFAEAPAAGVSILSHSPTHAGAQAYRALAGELLP
jgi:chromosome partitioning protein